MDETTPTKRSSCPTDEDGRRDPAQCGGGCPGCGGSNEPPQDGLTGLQFAVPAMVAFLLPLVAAIVGSLLGGDGNGRVIGAMVGLLAGLAAAILLGRIMNRPAGMGDGETNQYQIDTSEHIETYGDSNSNKRQADL